MIKGDDGVYRIGQVTEIKPGTEDPNFTSGAIAKVGEGFYRDQLRLETIADKLKDKITDDQLATPVDQYKLDEIKVAINGSDPLNDVQVKAAHILYSPNHDPSNQASLPPDDPAWATAKAAAQKTADELNAITDVTQREARFAEIAKAESDDTDIGADGGELGTFTKDQMVAEFADPLFSNANLKPGDIVGPVKSQFGYHVILFEERIPSSTDRVGEVKTELATPGADFAAIAKQSATATRRSRVASSAGRSALSCRPRCWPRSRRPPPAQTTGSIQASDAFYFEKVEDHQQLAPEGQPAAQLAATAFPTWYSTQKDAADQERHDPDEQGHLQPSRERARLRDRGGSPGRVRLVHGPVGLGQVARRRTSSSSCSGSAAARSPCSTATSCGRTSRPGSASAREDRDTNVRRIGFVAAEVVRHGGIVVAAVVSPYRATRDEVRAMMAADAFLEVFVDTPIEVCEDRDVKGWYAKARTGEVTGFTGVDDPYEPPLHPELTLHTMDTTLEANAQLVLDELRRRGYVDPA